MKAQVSAPEPCALGRLRSTDRRSTSDAVEGAIAESTTLEPSKHLARSTEASQMSPAPKRFVRRFPRLRRPILVAVVAAATSQTAGCITWSRSGLGPPAVMSARDPIGVMGLPGRVQVSGGGRWGNPAHVAIDDVIRVDQRMPSLESTLPIIASVGAGVIAGLLVCELLRELSPHSVVRCGREGRPLPGAPPAPHDRWLDATTLVRLDHGRRQQGGDHLGLGDFGHFLGQHCGDGLLRLNGSPEGVAGVWQRAMVGWDEHRRSCPF